MATAIKTFLSALAQINSAAFLPADRASKSKIANQKPEIP
jgi:hypothetical protein